MNGFFIQRNEAGEAKRMQERRVKIGVRRRVRDRKKSEKIRGRISEAMLACRRTLAVLYSVP